MEVVRSELSRIAKSGNSKNLKSLFERIIVNQIEILLDSQVQDDFEKDLTARQRKYLRRTHAVSPFGETSKCAYGIFFCTRQNAPFTF